MVRGYKQITCTDTAVAGQLCEWYKLQAKGYALSEHEFRLVRTNCLAHHTGSKNMSIPRASKLFRGLLYLIRQHVA